MARDIPPGDLANWHTGDPRAIPAVGGAMDLATGAKDVYVIMSPYGISATELAGRLDVPILR